MPDIVLRKNLLIKKSTILSDVPSAFCSGPACPAEGTSLFAAVAAKDSYLVIGDEAFNDMIYATTSRISLRVSAMLGIAG